MKNDVKVELAALKHMTPAELRERHVAVFSEPSRPGNKDYLVKRIGWRIQSLAEGGLSERAKARAAEIARDADVRMTAPKAEAVTVTKPFASPGRRLPMPGAVLTRQYQGRLIQVTVLPKGFEWEGHVFKSLSAVAKAVTGGHWNGYGFFGLLNGGDK